MPAAPGQEFCDTRPASQQHLRNLPVGAPTRAAPQCRPSTSDLPLPSLSSSGAMSQKEDSKPAVLKGPSALRSIIAGSTAGAIEIGESVPAAERPRAAHALPTSRPLLLTKCFTDVHSCSNYIPCRVYVCPTSARSPCPRRPNEFEVAKTRSQLNRRLPDGKKLGWPPFGRQWYAGCTTLIIGNSLKAGIRTSPLPAQHLFRTCA